MTLIEKLRAANCAGSVYPMMCEAADTIETLTESRDSWRESAMECQENTDRQNKRWLRKFTILSEAAIAVSRNFTLYDSQIHVVVAMDLIANLQAACEAYEEEIKRVRST